MDRRSFLAHTGAVLLSGGALGTAMSAEVPAAAATAEKDAAAKVDKKATWIPPKLIPPLVGSQLYGWGQYYDRQHRNLPEHLDEVFAALRDSGYDYAEGTLDVAVPENNGRLAERMKRNGLRPVSLYTGGAVHVLGKATETVERIGRAAREAARAGFGIINFNPDPIGRDKTASELEIQGEALRELGDDLASAGIRLGLHHHTPELRNGAREFHSNFSQCPGTNVGFCYDVHWVFRGGIVPSDCLERYGHRIVSWHLRQSRGQTWWEDLDTGDVDYAAIAGYARSHALPQFYTVELALENGTRITRDAVENHARSRRFVRTTFGV